MTIANLKELESLLKVLRKHGVQTCTIDGIELKLGDAPAKKTEDDSRDLISEPTFTDEQVLLWSAGNL